MLVPAQLYNALYDYALRLPSCLELTIEDPSEEFEDLRDRNDLKRLIQGENAIADCEEIKRGAPVDKMWAEKVRKEGKYAKVSFLISRIGQGRFLKSTVFLIIKNVSYGVWNRDNLNDLLRCCC